MVYSFTGIASLFEVLTLWIASGVARDKAKEEEANEEKDKQVDNDFKGKHD
jgi:hypothetical protein